MSILPAPWFELRLLQFGMKILKVNVSTSQAPFVPKAVRMDAPWFKDETIFNHRVIVS